MSNKCKKYIQLLNIYENLLDYQWLKYELNISKIYNYQNFNEIYNSICKTCIFSQE